MFRWYQDSRICYAYLSDVSRDAPLTLDSEFSRSRWYTRGWTLQELIAPADLRFYSKDWCLLGNKSELSPIIHFITHIEPKFLDSKNLELASVAKRMSWASNRNTSRVEDIAYCLLGIFDVNMPLLYGEGKKAFRRLQEEIIKVRFDDHSIFAWGTVVPRSSIYFIDDDVLWGRKDIPWSEPVPLLGLLAESPRDFASSGKFIPSPVADGYYRHRDRANIPLPVVAGSEIRIQLPIAYEGDTVYHWKRPRISQIRSGLVVILPCGDEEHRHWLLRIPLQISGQRNYGRTKELIFDDEFNLINEWERALDNTELLHIAPEKRKVLGCGDVIIQRHILGHSHKWFYVATVSGVDYSGGEQLAAVNGQVYGHLFEFRYELKTIGEDYGFSLLFSRHLQLGVLHDGHLFVGLAPVHFRNLPDSQRSVNYKGIQWQDCRQDTKPMFSHAMAIPSDIWELDAKPFPLITVSTRHGILTTAHSLSDLPSRPQVTYIAAIAINLVLMEAQPWYQGLIHIRWIFEVY
ncbi:uncharacterized protein F4807DRAFT_154026 [Annulohypoxylon truncatum]|uniref:uncharacterized protein n=1 Tax=Annulohypoxylon truncatum TaxID=327061 RepID=UPI002008077B|nr:uncharacterized protein F4807DRAFT_154026 [Annulohypoxylon truncatum]KAI1208125.1 hypothetical protein F4807DRAFT_154026 [Annulohypoxylon truncatum]